MLSFSRLSLAGRTAPVSLLAVAMVFAALPALADDEGRTRAERGTERGTEHGAEQQVQKPAPPADAEVAAVVKQLKVVYANEYARRSPDDRHSLARHLLRQARKRDRDAVERYAMLSEAHALSLQAGEAWTAYTAVNQMDRQYTIKALDMKQDIVTTAARTVRDPRDGQAVLKVGFVVLDQLVAADRYDDATQIAGQLRNPAIKAGDASMAERVNSYTRHIASMRTQYRRLQGHLQTLVTHPDDPAALETVGRFYALVKGDWERGLPMLAGGNDQAMASLAKRDLSNPEDADAMLALADAYWKLANANASTEAGVNFRNRAGHWYRAVLPKLEGIARQAAARRASSPDAVNWAGMSFEPGLVGKYYEDQDRKGLKHRRVDQEVDFDWGVARPAPRMPTDKYMIEWTGWLRPPAEGEYIIGLESRGQSTLRIDGQLVLRASDGETTEYLTRAFVPVTLVYTKWRGPSKVIMTWRPVGSDPEDAEPIGEGSLFHRLDEQ